MKPLGTIALLITKGIGSVVASNTNQNEQRHYEPGAATEVRIFECMKALACLLVMFGFCAERRAPQAQANAAQRDENNEAERDPTRATLR